MEVILNRVDQNYHFEGIGTSEITVQIDGSEEIGGSNSGARPMELLLMGLGSCGAMDIVSILKKQKQNLRDFKIIINGERDYDQTPAMFTNIKIDFQFHGDLDPNKVEKAVNLSMEKYCSVSAMLEKTTNISYSFEIIKT